MGVVNTAGSFTGWSAFSAPAKTETRGRAVAYIYLKKEDDEKRDH
jgi:hypothetical protein